MPAPPAEDRRPPPGPLPGAVLGSAAGVLLGWVWLFGAGDVALATTAVFAALVVAVAAGAPAWRRFAAAMALGAALGFAVAALILG